MSKKLASIIKSNKSNQLESIMNKMPSATVPEIQPVVTLEQITAAEERIIQTTEKLERIVADIPYNLKRQIRQYLVDHPGETEKTVILKGLKAIGFQVSEADMFDLRGKKR